MISGLLNAYCLNDPVNIRSTAAGMARARSWIRYDILRIFRFFFCFFYPSRYCSTISALIYINAFHELLYSYFFISCPWHRIPLTVYILYYRYLLLSYKTSCLAVDTIIYTLYRVFVFQKNGYLYNIMYKKC